MKLLHSENRELEYQWLNKGLIWSNNAATLQSKLIISTNTNCECNNSRISSEIRISSDISHLKWLYHHWSKWIQSVVLQVMDSFHKLSSIVNVRCFVMYIFIVDEDNT